MHEDAPFELQLGLAALVNELLVREFVLGLAQINVLAAEKDCLKEVDVILRE